jgi:hypothetical protein
MRRLAVLLMMILAGCSNRSSVPNDIIQPDSMQKIMRDVILAEQYSVQYLPKDSLKPDKLKANQDMLAAIFKIHGVTREDFKKSLQFYESRPDMSKKIFDSLSEDANRHKQLPAYPKPMVKALPVR